jgi:transcription antitermination factor NusG
MREHVKGVAACPSFPRLVNGYSGHEERVKKNLEQRIKLIDSGDEICRIVVPTEEEVEVRGGQRRTVARKILPGYVEMLFERALYQFR